MHFDTLLIIFGLTYQLSAPQCQFLFSAVFVFQVFPLLKVLEKFWENHINNQRRRTFRKSQSGARGPPPGAQAPWWRGPTLDRAQGAPRLPGGPWLPPFAYIYPSLRKPSGHRAFSRSLLCSAATAVSRSGLSRDPAP